MQLNEALTIVLELAYENALSQNETLEDPEVLGPMRDQQQEALKRVNVVKLMLDTLYA